MRKSFLLFIFFIVGGASADAQAFNLKELLQFKDHNIDFFHDYVTKKGYTYEKSKYDEKREHYSYVFLDNIEDDLHEIKYAATDMGAKITYQSTDSSGYEQIKKQLDVLGFRFVKYVPKQENGRGVLMMVYTDGNREVDLYNSYIEDDEHALVRLYRVKVD
jgi:hypothetical protein